MDGFPTSFEHRECCFWMLNKVVDGDLFRREIWRRFKTGCTEILVSNSLCLMEWLGGRLLLEQFVFGDFCCLVEMKA